MTNAPPRRSFVRRWLSRLAWAFAGVIVIAFASFLVAYFRSTNACAEPAAAVTDPMKAVVYCDYGSPEVLRIEDVEKPKPTDDQVLVKVRAVSVNPLDWHVMEGKPYLMRMMAGLRKPKDTRLGVDFAGTVEAVGRNVTDFKPGDEVFGGGDGSFAEYVCVRHDGAVVLAPAGLPLEQAAAIPIAGITALQSLRDRGKAHPGQKVLINGASGGVGTFAVQIAKLYGADVTGVCSTRNVEMVRSLGADHVVDYTKEDFANAAERYDLLIDNVGNRSLSECRRVLKPGGVYALIGGGGPRDNTWLGPFGRIVFTPLYSKLSDRQMAFFLASMRKDDLAVLADLIGSGKVKPVIDRTYPFAQIAEAMRYVEEGHARAKVLVTFP